MTGLIKIHKKDTPISPVINWENTPHHIKLNIHQKKFRLESYTCLPYVQNTLINNRREISYEELKVPSFNISNMYTDIQRNELTNV
jgi:hypothetical protein